MSDAPTAEFRGRAFARGADGYEEARRAAVWNARTPPRYPDLIVQLYRAFGPGTLSS